MYPLAGTAEQQSCLKVKTKLRQPAHFRVLGSVALQIRVFFPLPVAITVTDKVNTVLGSSIEFGGGSSEQTAVR